MSAKTGRVLQCKVCKNSVYIPGKRLNTFRYCSYKCVGISKKGLIPKTAFKINDPRITGDGNYQWKGDQASYVAKHRWVKKWFGIPNHCELCGQTGKRKYHWANKSGDYKRERQDWIQLCVPCHSKYDNHGNKSRITWYKNHPQYQQNR